MDFGENVQIGLNLPQCLERGETVVMVVTESSQAHEMRNGIMGCVTNFAQIFG